MKTQTTSIHFKNVKNSFTEIIKEANEIISGDLKHPGNKTTFSVADFWYIRKMKRNRVYRRSIV